MANDALATYLNDHLAGSVMILELLDRLVDEVDEETAAALREVRAGIAADRDELESLMARWQVGLSPSRQATAWVAEKLTALKLHFDDPARGALRRLETLETVALGLLGKQALWQALARATAEAPELGVLDVEPLLRRGAEQHAVVEPLRVRAAADALGAA